MATVITISGKGQHGKDLSAIIMKEMFESDGKKAVIIHYADYLKFIAKEYFGWNGEKDEAGRTLLQWLGTDKIRKVMPDFWVDIVISFIKAFEDDYDYFLIPDTRFPNEIDKMSKNFRTKAIHVTRLNFDNGMTEEQKRHVSETALDGHHFDWYIESETGREKLTSKIAEMVCYYQL